MFIFSCKADSCILQPVWVQPSSRQQAAVSRQQAGRPAGVLSDQKPISKTDTFTEADDGDDSTRRYMDDLRGRGQPSFRMMPSWMSDDDDMSELAHRMSHAPHFATFRRGAPFRERRSSGGSAMSATSEDDSCDVSNADKASQCSGGSTSSTGEAHQIPIRIEAEAPPAKEQVPHSAEPVLHDPTEPIPCPPPASLDPHFARVGQPRKMPQYATRTTSAVEGRSMEDVPRDARCASAPPDMVPQSPRFVSKINITPQQSPRPAPFSPLTSNSVPKPWVPNHHYSNGTHQGHATPQKQQHKPHHQEPPQPHQDPIQEEEQPQVQQMSQEQQQQPQQPQQQPPPPQHHVHHQQQQPQQQQQYQHQQQQHYPQYQQQEPQQQYHQQQFVPPSSSPPQWGCSGGGGGRPQQKSVVRNIPIFVEGRDSPIVNEDKVDSPAPQQPSQYQQHHAQQQQQQPQQQQQQPQQQQQHPQQHPHFEPQQQQWRQQFPQHPHHLKQQFRSQSQPTVHSQFFHGQPQATKPEPPQPQPQPQPQPVPQQQAQQPPQPQPQTQPQPQPQVAVDPRIATIEAVAESLKEYKARAEAFNGDKKEKEFLFLDEMLTRALLKLDNIDPDGKEDVRQARRTVIKEINTTISMLEAKAQKKESSETVPNSCSSEAASEAMETEAAAEERPAEGGEETKVPEASTTSASKDNSQETTETALKGEEAAASPEAETTAAAEAATAAAAAAPGGEEGSESVAQTKAEEEKVKTEAS